jgi:hypothetical protein
MPKGLVIAYRWSMLAIMNEQDNSTKVLDNPLSPDTYSKKIKMLCAVHGVPCGSPANLAMFLRAVNEDKCLAMNFWSLMARMHDLEQGSNEVLLEAIAEGVTGRSVVEVHAAGGEPRWLMKQMAAMLAGEDIDIAAVVQVPAAAVREIARAAVESAPAVALTAPVAAATAVSAEMKWQAVSIRQEEERSRLVLEPEMVGLQPFFGQRALFGVDLREPKVEVREIRVPLEGYGERSANGSVRMIAFAVLMVVAMCGAAFVARGDAAVLQHKVGPSVRAGYDAAWRGVKGLGDWAGNAAFGR